MSDRCRVCDVDADLELHRGAIDVSDDTTFSERRYHILRCCRHPVRVHDPDHLSCLLVKLIINANVPLLALLVRKDTEIARLNLITGVRGDELDHYVLRIGDRPFYVASLE